MLTPLPVSAFQVKPGHSNWDIGPANNPSTPTAMSIRGVDATDQQQHDAVHKSSIASSTHQKLAISTNNAASTPAPAGGDPSGAPTNQSLRVVVDYGDDLSISPQPADVGRKETCCGSPILTFLEELLSPGLLLSPTFIFMLLSNVFTIWGEFVTQMEGALYM